VLSNLLSSLCPLSLDSPLLPAEASRRGLGAIQLDRPTKLATMVAGIVAGSPIPVTVKIRIGQKKDKINAPRVVEMLERTGAAAIIIHGRTMEQG
jgi:tRNA-dihydrouridine synthase